MSLDELRNSIDEIDAQIVRLINQRARVSQQIGEEKRAQGKHRVFVPRREKEVYEKIAALNTGPLPDQCFRAIYREIMAGSIALQSPTRVSYFGPPGSFTHMAARSKFGAAIEYLPAADIRDVFLAVSRGHAHYGLVPIENSTEGGVNQTIDMFIESNLKICSELYVPIHQHLMSNSPVDAVTVIYSHPQAFAQCRSWLSGNMQNVRKQEVSSTSAGAFRAAKEKGAAAIASLMAAEIYNLPLLFRNLEDNPENTTRFFVISEEWAEPSGKDKTSLMFSIKDEPGALLRMLESFGAEGINLTRIESRPSKRKAWDYVFFVDLEGHIAEARVKRALEELEKRCRHLELLGSYPAAEMVAPPPANA